MCSVSKAARNTARLQLGHSSLVLAKKTHWLKPRTYKTGEQSRESYKVFLSTFPEYRHLEPGGGFL